MGNEPHFDLNLLPLPLPLPFLDNNRSDPGSEEAKMKLFSIFFVAAFVVIAFSSVNGWFVDNNNQCDSDGDCPGGCCWKNPADGASYCKTGGAWCHPPLGN